MLHDRIIREEGQTKIFVNDRPNLVRPDTKHYHTGIVYSQMQLNFIQEAR